jgi:hypothetical protein
VISHLARKPTGYYGVNPPVRLGRRFVGDVYLLHLLNRSRALLIRGHVVRARLEYFKLTIKYRIMAGVILNKERIKKKARILGRLPR